MLLATTSAACMRFELAGPPTARAWEDAVDECAHDNVVACADLAAHEAKRDPARSLALYEKVCATPANGQNQLIVAHACEEIAKRDVRRAMDLKIRACRDAYGESCKVACEEARDATACWRVGASLEYTDRAASEKLMMLACDAGELRACDDLGARRQNAVAHAGEAIALYRRACDGGLARGCGHLASEERDPETKKRLGERGCDLGDEQACRALATLVEQSGDAERAQKLVERAEALGAATRVDRSYVRDKSPPILAPGILYSTSTNREAIGVEATLTFPHGDKAPFNFNPVLGVFAQAQVVAGYHARFALGPQLSFGPFGVELGAELETGDGVHVATGSVHIAPFLSLGYVSVALRVAQPVTSGVAYDSEVGIMVALKLPFYMRRK